MSNRGIDYGGGVTNIDKDTRIRYGVISVHDVTQFWCDESEADYGNPTCPKCGNDAVDYCDWTNDNPDIDTDEWDKAKYECEEYICPDCKYIFGGESAYPDEANSHYLDSDEYKATDCLDSDIMILKSPYYTFAQFCSPCVPGAGNLNNPIEDGTKAYCFGHDCFEDGIAPYPVYRVSDDVQIIAARKTVDCEYCHGMGFRSTIGLAKRIDEPLTDDDIRICEERILMSYKERPELYKGHVLNQSNHTCTCFTCNGTGKVERVIETEQT